MANKKLGRPPLNKPSNRIKITVDVTKETHAKMTALRKADGRSLGRLIDAAISTL